LFEPDRQGREDFFENWFVTMDLICVNPLTYLPIASYFFIGYGIGVVFFFLPESIGRKKTIALFNSIYIYAVYLLAFDERIVMKKLGFFLEGLFHLKISTSFTHALELVPESKKSIVFTVMLPFDSASILIACLYF